MGMTYHVMVELVQRAKTKKRCFMMENGYIYFRSLNRIKRSKKDYVFKSLFSNEEFDEGDMGWERIGFPR